MRAAILDHSPYQLRVVDGWPEPAAGAGQVIVQVRGVGICGSDLALLAGRRKPPALPWVPGHETFGVIVATGQDIDPGRVGERVVIEPNVPCFECPACAAGRTSACPCLQILGFNAPGTLAERVVVPAGLAWPVPRTWTDQDAVCAEPLAVAQAAIRRSGASACMRCLVVGAGVAGDAALPCPRGHGRRSLRARAAPGRLEVAASLGARPASAQDDGFQLAFETSGLAAAFAEAVRRTAGGGGIVAIGMSSEPLGLTSQTLVSPAADGARLTDLRPPGRLRHDDASGPGRSSPRPRTARLLPTRRRAVGLRGGARSTRQVPGFAWAATGHPGLYKNYGRRSN